MFDSADAGFIPIIILTIICSWFISGTKELFVRVIATLCIPIMISFAWFFVPRFTELFKPLGPHQDPWVVWGLAATMLWSTVAAPINILSVWIFWRVRREKAILPKDK